MAGTRTLIVTLPPFQGGVPAQTRLLAEYLRLRGQKVTVAYYATFAHHSDLCVPSWAFWQGRRPSVREHRCFDDFPCIAVGCRFPEFEFPYYLPSERWQRLIETHDRHIAVSGPPLIAYPLARMGVKHFLWCASGTHADRRDRIRKQSRPRRLVHDILILPILERLEQRILTSATAIRGVSDYTARSLAALGAPGERVDVLPIPVEEGLFTPPAVPAAAGIVGFAGRFEDPRKNLDLLLRTTRRAQDQGCQIVLHLAGAAPSPATRARVTELGLDDAVRFMGELPARDLPDFYRSLDAFVIPSLQEGLCISGLQAMACGVPVITTRCGGPEDYVRPGETGLLVDDEPQLAQAMVDLTEQRTLRRRLSEGARRLIESHYSLAAFHTSVDLLWRQVWGENP